MKKRRGNKKGQQVDRSHSGGLGMAEVWVKLFKANAENMAAKNFDKCLTEEQLTTKMLEAFPSHAESQILRQPNRVRNRYNRGELTKGRIPKPLSVKFQRQETPLLSQKIGVSGKETKKSEKD